MNLRENGTPRVAFLVGRANQADLEAYLAPRPVKKHSFGRPLLEAGTRFAFHTETLQTVCDSRVGFHESERLAEHARQASPTPITQPNVLSLCEGIGSTSFCLANTFGETATVEAVELDPRAVAYAQYNVERAGLENCVSIIQQDARTFIADAVKKGHRYDAIFLDPPWEDDWHGTPAEVSPLLEQLAKDAVQCSPVVAFRLPAPVAAEDIAAFAHSLNRGAETVIHEFEGLDPLYAIKTVYLLEQTRDITQQRFLLPTGAQTFVPIASIDLPDIAEKS